MEKGAVLSVCGIKQSHRVIVIGYLRRSSVDMADYGVSVQQLNDLLSDENGHFSMPSRDFNEVYPRILLGNEYVLLKY